MKIQDYRGFQLHVPQSGGKAGKGRNKTGTVQVRYSGQIMKQFRFDRFSTENYFKAVDKARAYVDNWFGVSEGDSKALLAFLRHGSLLAGLCRVRSVTYPANVTLANVD